MLILKDALDFEGPLKIAVFIKNLNLLLTAAVTGAFLQRRSQKFRKIHGKKTCIGVSV